MKPTRSDRPSLRLMISSVAVSAMLFVHNAAAFTIATNPPFLPTPLPPNIIMSFDDSGSMRWAYAPDSMCSEYATRRVKSSDYNPLYYNPKVRYDPPVKYDAATGTYSEYTTSFSNAYIIGFYQLHGTVNLGSNYRPTWSKNPAVAEDDEGVGWGKNLCSDNNEKIKSNFAFHPSADFADTRAGVQAYYYVYDTTLAACTSKVVTNDACYRRVFVTSSSGPGTIDLNGDGKVDANDKDERQNFAVWYSFYRTRNLMTATAATRALVGVPPTARVGWQSLSSCNSTTSLGTTTGRLFDATCAGWSNVNVDKRLKVFDGQHRANLLNWLSRLPANGSTPLREAASRAGEYFRTNGVNSPYAQTPTVSLGTEYSCRPNFHILMTDGVWNDSTGYFCSGSSCSNKDSASRTLPDGKGYSPRSPHKDANSSSVADIAFHYWATDLRSDLANNLLPYRVDRTGTDDAQYWNPKNDPATWQHVVMFTVGLGLGRTFTDPLIPWGGSTYAGAGYTNLVNGTANWPATGADVVPGNVYDLWHAALNSRGQSFSADNPRDLSDALATAVNRILERESASAALATNSARLSTDTLLFQARFFSGTWTGSLTAYAVNPDGSLGGVQWEATAPGKIPAPSARSIYTWSGTSGIAFEQGALNAAGLWTPIGSQAMLDYLRGDTKDEIKNGGLYRNRSTLLADIVNSDPAFVATENFGYSTLASEGASYPAFMAAKKSRLKMLYVGSNDGFLRAFNASTGHEAFAYVPAAVVPDMPALSNPNYTHRFYVDGPPAAWDAYFGGGWKTVLMGTTGAGGKSVFALDVTNPGTFSASNVLWEINQNRAKRADEAVDPQYGSRLGYTIGQAVVAKLNNGEWAAIFGNGYRSTSEQASLYIVRVSDGKLIRRIDTGVGALATPNGLGTPTLYDSNGDDVYDVVYAPDMRGNVWKFSLSGSDPAAWDVAFKPGTTGFPNGLPLFQARSSAGAVQPLSARIELASPPAGKSGIMVLFGTGRLIAVNDNTDATGQSFYGIWDNGSPVTATNRSSLREQDIETATIDLRGVSTEVRKLSGESVDWSTQRGWYIDLPTSLERVIGAASVRDGRVIFTTVVPSNDPCVFGGSGWLMELDATNGARLPYSVFDTTGDELVTSADQNIAGVPLGVGMVKKALVLDGSPVAAKFLSGTTSEIQVERNRTFGQTLGRESWREVQR
jgi:type IV pilus assembly protein PilY1